MQVQWLCWTENGRLQLRGQLRHWGCFPAPHSRFTFYEGTDDGWNEAQSDIRRNHWRRPAYDEAPDDRAENL